MVVGRRGNGGGGGRVRQGGGNGGEVGGGKHTGVEIVGIDVWRLPGSNCQPGPHFGPAAVTPAPRDSALIPPSHLPCHLNA